MDCDPTCLNMVQKFYKGKLTLLNLRQGIQLTKEGTNLYGLGLAAEDLGFKSLAVQLTSEKLLKEAPLPAILHW